jgi:hypothetical protein
MLTSLCTYTKNLPLPRNVTLAPLLEMLLQIFFCSLLDIPVRRRTIGNCSIAFLPDRKYQLFDNQGNTSQNPFGLPIGLRKQVCGF